LVDGEIRLGKTSPRSAGLITEIGREAERLAAALPAKVRQAAAEEARRQAVALWHDIKKMKPSQWRVAATFAPELRRWVFVKLVGEESAREASVDTGRALELARRPSDRSPFLGAGGFRPGKCPL
jgi:hypothetical protein